MRNDAPPLAVFFGLALTLGGRVDDDRSVSAEAFDGPRLARAIFLETNRVRREHRVPPCRWDVRLDRAAAKHVATLALMLKLSHESPIAGQRTPAERVEAAGILPAEVRENLSSRPLWQLHDGRMERCTYAELAVQIVRQWLDSPAHRANLLSAGVSHAGGAVQFVLLPIRQESVFAVQLFCRPQRPAPPNLTEPAGDRR